VSGLLESGDDSIYDDVTERNGWPNGEGFMRRLYIRRCAGGRMMGGCKRWLYLQYNGVRVVEDGYSYCAWRVVRDGYTCNVVKVVEDGYSYDDGGL
jgi:hypothetical protein